MNSQQVLLEWIPVATTPLLCLQALCNGSIDCQVSTFIALETSARLFLSQVASRVIWSPYGSAFQASFHCFGKQVVGSLQTGAQTVFIGACVW